MTINSIKHLIDCLIKVYGKNATQGDIMRYEGIL